LLDSEQVDAQELQRIKRLVQQHEARLKRRQGARDD
jgi:hypothetical protein